ncbi:Lysophospholipase L1 [Pricia antarctica]|uniref:Lysophospholipase L1 n=1 Tax=Pricia antarctica TaxID=641691 RepID=A0A1G6X6W3_9FLAO|nr:SGNH/GDSL hydrolase family protein [Pricia antarctica]SDD73910.1 Lysophospholipase L1 [Pricia antarctica]
MTDKGKILCVLFLVIATLASAQKQDNSLWHTVSDSVQRLEGQGWENIGFNRLPDKAENSVRDAVWNLSSNSAGLGVRFETDADTIIVQYEVGGGLAMEHMPATGVSGVDLYVKNGKDWLWARGERVFNDTIRYTFELNALSKGIHEHQLLFPLYNNIKTLQVGVKGGSSFRFLPPRPEKPVVVYGTSIAQGACASRPGMAWTNILSRKLDYPVVNLGFSGNGRLEPEVIDLINEIDASVFVLDCLPNLSPNEKRTKEEIQKRIRESVLSLRKKHPQTPILLVQHAGYSDGPVDTSRKKVYETLNSWMTESFDALKRDGFEKMYLLTKAEIGLSNDAFVDGTHPTDLGMAQYAAAYEKILEPLVRQ